MTIEETKQITQLEVDWDWEKFRREAAKETVQGVLSNDKIMGRIWEHAGDGKHPLEVQKMVVNVAIRITDELIRQLKEEKNEGK